MYIITGTVVLHVYHVLKQRECLCAGVLYALGARKHCAILLKRGIKKSVNAYKELLHADLLMFETCSALTVQISTCNYHL